MFLLTSLIRLGIYVGNRGPTINQSIIDQLFATLSRTVVFGISTAFKAVLTDFSYVKELNKDY
ncbi:hypothetical protein [Xylocopilactobacillus apicola]|uniref:Uncharacterized protein n=1 Tax=Xylocopilactobacillus apicola TaxID=2932184 RepID=A0AAU9DLS7_9LACO|nr:hypothetical protein [Xylocopilactobacillus apicola]BDR57852.1 hypothetical protein XA3_02930 [Xylocopilactobacillus apicola]